MPEVPTPRWQTQKRGLTDLRFVAVRDRLTAGCPVTLGMRAMRYRIMSLFLREERQK